MARLRWIQMPEQERNDFLGDSGTGVLSFSTGEGAPSAAPVSYGYVADTGHFHFRLSFPPDSEKRRFVDRPVTFVTYGKTGESWWSVVASGELDDLTAYDAESVAVQERWAVDIPLVDIFEEPPDEVDFRAFRLVPESVTGRKSVGADE